MNEATGGARIVQDRGADGYATTLEAMARAFEPKVAPSISQWAATHRILSASSSEPGRWRNERIPYLRAIMDSLEVRDPAPIVVFVKSSQVGGSQCGLNWIGRNVYANGGSFLCLFPTEKVGKKWVRGDLDPMIASSPSLRLLVPRGRRSNSGNTLTEKHAPGGFKLLVGSANIKDDVAGVSVPNLFLDEVDRMPRLLEDEGDPIDLAMMRSVTYPRGKAFLVSTPTTEETSRIWPLWLTSTMHRYYVPCPECGHAQYLRWEQISYPEGEPDKARYRCESCAALIEERHKTQMLAAGEWVAEHPERASETKGFHINAIYTPVGLGLSWARHARAWERAKGSPEKMQPFFNTRLGEVVKSNRKTVSWEAPYGRREPYALRTIPPGVLFLTSGTDVQKDRLETQIVGWSRGERATIIDTVIHYGDTTRLARLEGEADREPTAWEALDEYLARPIETAAGVPMRLSCSLVDSGYLTDTVLGFTRERKARNIFASRGSSIALKLPIGRPTYPDVKGRGRANDKRGVERYELGVSVIKHWIFDRLEADVEAPMSSRHIRFSNELHEEYFRQFTAEKFDPKDGWVQDANYHKNEMFDTFVMARGASLHHVVAIHRMREADWVRLEELYARAPAKREPEPLGKAPIQTTSGFLPISAKVR